MARNLVPLFTSHQLKTFRDNFFSELVDAAKGKKNSLAFIRNPLPETPIVKDNEKFQTMVIGGSVFKKALLIKKADEIKALKLEQESLPDFKDEQEFQVFISDHIYDGVEAIGINFAQALEPDLQKGVLDGKLLGCSKELKLDEFVGKSVGDEIEKFVLTKKRKTINVGVANDTVCLILSGLNVSDWKSFIGGIVGTGTNFGFFIKEKTVVNLESGNFDKFDQSDTGKRVADQSLKPSEHLFEKEVTGAYLHKHFNILPKESLKSTEDLNKIATSDNGSQTIIAQKLFERSASLIAAQIGGLYLFKKQPKLVCAIEGSLFWKGFRYKLMVEDYLQKLEVPKGSVKFIRIENSGILGAAKLVA